MDRVLQRLVSAERAFHTDGAENEKHVVKSWIWESTGPKTQQTMNGVCDSGSTWKPEMSNNQERCRELHLKQWQPILKAIRFFTGSQCSDCKTGVM